MVDAIIEKQVEEKIAGMISGFLADATKFLNLSVNWRVVNAWGVAPDGAVQGESTPVDDAVVGVAVGAPRWENYLNPTAEMTVALSIGIRREVAPDAAALEAVMRPVSYFLSGLQLDVARAEELTTENFSVGGVRVDGGPPPSFNSSTNMWRVTRTFVVRGVVEETNPNT
jgi:hypothetical protein